MNFFSVRRNVEILAIIIGVVVILLLCFRKRLCGKLSKLSAPPPIKNIEEGIVAPAPEVTHTEPPLEDNSFFLSAGNVSVGDRISGDNFDEGQEYNHRDRVWLDTWQTKVHHPSEFAKSVMAIVLPAAFDSDGKYEEMLCRSPMTTHEDTNCDKEMLVIPAIMTAGMCDHNLALGQFLWSPSKATSQSHKYDKYEDRARQITAASCQEEYEMRNHERAHRESHHRGPYSCGATQTPLSPLTTPASEVVSALSSVKSSSSQTHGNMRMQQDAVINVSTGRVERVKDRVIARSPYQHHRNIPHIPHMPQHQHYHISGMSSPSSPRVRSSSSSSSASALSPPPPSASSISLLLPTISEDVGGRIHYNNSYSYSLRYQRDERMPNSPSQDLSTTTQDLSSPNTYASKRDHRHHLPHLPHLPSVTLPTYGSKEQGTNTFHLPYDQKIMYINDGQPRGTFKAEVI